MLKIRLSKTGKKNAPSYRVVVIPEEKPRDGEAVEILGHFNPSVKPPTLSLDKERLKHWLGKGAQMTEAVKNLVEGKYKFKPYIPKKAETVAKEAGEAAPEKGKEEKKTTTTEGVEKKESAKQNEK